MNKVMDLGYHSWNINNFTKINVCYTEKCFSPIYRETSYWCYSEGHPSSIYGYKQPWNKSRIMTNSFIPFIIPFICHHFTFFLVPFSFRSTDLCLGLMLLLRKKISRHRAPNGNRISANRRSPTEWVKCVVSVGGILTAAPVGARTPSSCHARTPSGCHAGTSNKNRSIAEYFTYTSILSTPSSTASRQQDYGKWNRTSSTSACRTRLPLK